MKLMKKITGKAAVAKTAVATSALALTVNAQAALPDGVKTALEAGFTDAREGAALVVVGLVGIFAILLLKRVIR